MSKLKKLQSQQFRYNWYETNIARFLSKYHLPISYQGDFLQFVLTYKEQFLSDYKALLLNGDIPGYPSDIYENIGNSYSFVEHFFDDIISVINCWESGEIGNAETIINDLFKNVEQDFCVRIIDDKNFFRVRIPNNNDDFSKDPLNLFHIPYQMKHLARNDRYNMAGRPCLYLSSRLNLAWKECGMPQMFYYSKFENKMVNNFDWKYLYFPSPQEVKNLLVGSIDDDLVKLIIKYIRSYPLVFICSIVNLHHDKPYKPEYIFPQLLMQWIERNFDKIKGVVYFPCVDYDDIRLWKGYNIVMPANVDKDGYSIPLKNAFTITTPIFQDNRLSDKGIRTIFELQTKLSNFMLPQNEMGDCLYHMDLMTSRIVKLTKRIMEIDSVISLSYIEMLLDDIWEFKKKFPLAKVLQSCKDSETYQDRYEKSYIEFSDLYQDFFNVIEIFDKYFAYLDRGFEYEKP